MTPEKIKLKKLKCLKVEKSDQPHRKMTPEKIKLKKLKCLKVEKSDQPHRKMTPEKMKPFEFSFEKLIVWQKTRALVKALYEQTRAFPSEERFALADQIRRAGVSVASNIAEGTSRRSPKDQVRFIEIAYGSLMEICCQLQLAADVGIISEKALAARKVEIREIALMLNALRNSFFVRPRPNSENSD